MAHLFITILWILVAICCVVALYYIVLWVFAQLGIPLPDMALKIAFVILVLLIIIWLVSALFGGGGLPSFGRINHLHLPFRGGIS